jgi:hypothetical protein
MDSENIIARWKNNLADADNPAGMIELDGDDLDLAGGNDSYGSTSCCSCYGSSSCCGSNLA